MKPPAKAVVGNRIWSGDGAAVWALYAVAPTPYANSGMDARLAVHARLRAALLTLPAESMLLGISEPVDPAMTINQLSAPAGMGPARDTGGYGWAAACADLHRQPGV